MNDNAITAPLTKCPDHGLSLGPDDECTACRIAASQSPSEAPNVVVLPPDECRDLWESQARWTASHKAETREFNERHEQNKNARKQTNKSENEE